MRTQFYAKSLTLLLLWIPFSGFCQVADSIFIGKLHTDYRGYEIRDMFGTSDSYFYILRENRRKEPTFLIQKISIDSLHVIDSEMFNLPEVHGKNPNLESTLSIGDKNYLLTTTHNAVNDTVNILAFEILDPLAIKPIPKLLAHGVGRILNAKKGYRVYKDTANALFTILVPSELYPNRNGKFEIRLFDKSLDLMKFKSLVVPYTSEVLGYADALVDGTSAFYLLLSVANPTLSSLNKERNIGKDYSLFKYSWQAEALTEKVLSFGGKWLYEAELIINSAQNIQIVGYFSNMVDLIMAGTFSLVLDRRTGELIHQGMSQFDRDFRVRFRPDRSLNSDTQLAKFKVNNIFALPNTKTLLLSEKNYTESTIRFNPAIGTSTVATVYNYDEIFVTLIDESSKIYYSLYISKYQSSLSSVDNYTSYLSFRNNKKTYIVYNDDHRNESLDAYATDGYRQLTTPRNSMAMMIVIDSLGQMAKRPLFTPSDFREVLNPNLYYQTAHAVILTAATGNEVRFIKLKLD